MAQPPSKVQRHAPKTLFITGVSSGFGHALAREALGTGHRVIGTVRTQADLQAFEQLHPTHAHGVLLDVTDFERIDSAVAEVEASHGPADVLVNNGGYGHECILGGRRSQTGAASSM